MKFLTVIFLLLVIQQCFSKYIDGLHVVGNQIYNSDNQLVKLRGVTKSGTEFMCIANGGIFDGPYNSSIVEVIKSWNVNIVRIPLNEDCWLGINGVEPAYGGQNYQNAIRQWSDLLYSYGIASILDLHWTAPGSIPAKGQYPMPDTDHSILFWQQVANAYKNDGHVILEPFNEPYPDNNAIDSTAAWQCWRDGGNCQNINYNVAGMQTLVNTIRSTGAKNIIALGGINYSNSLRQWLQYKPTDSLNQLAAVWHSYSTNPCNNVNCWNQYVAPVAKVVPLIATEIGEYDCQDSYINGVMPYLDNIGAQYLAWTFNTWNCNSGPALISSYDGTPTNYGIGYKAHIANHTLSH